MNKKYKRILAAISLSFLLLISGVMLLEHHIEFTGILFLSAAIGILLYLPFSWFWNRRKKQERTPITERKEVQVVVSLLTILCGIGAIATYETQFIISIVFWEILLVTLIFLYVNFIKTEIKEYTFPEWFLILFFLGNMLLILSLEDSYGNEETFAIATFGYFLLAIVLIFRWIFRSIQSIIQLRKEQKQTELLHLQSQVNPHFFFNMLNNLYGWVGKDTKTAKSLILQISDMMRYSIYEGQKEVVFLEEEVAYLKNYIALHKMRYHKEITVNFEVDIPENRYQIQPLLFIILLENAFKHGVENLREHAFVDLVLQANDGNIHFIIKNNFDAEKEAASTGIGLKNLKRRLALVYPKKHTLNLEVEENIYKAELNIQLT